MGMFDYLNYNGQQYQTKDTPSQSMETYELRDGELWYNEVETEWSDECEPLFRGYFKEISSEWKRVTNFDGVIEFYTYRLQSDGSLYSEMWKALLMDGKVLKLERTK